LFEEGTVSRNDLHNNSTEQTYLLTY